MNRYPLEFASRKIGIITPYRSQLSLLRSKFTSSFGPEIVAEMEINTVDGFQGREVDILLLSTVRASNSSGDRHHTGEARSIGFVADVRRMNVALTRARLSLWIVGNARTLRINSHWDSLVCDAEERNLFVSIKRPYGSMFEKGQPHSRDTHRYHTSHLKQKDNKKAALMSSKRIDAQLQEQPTHAIRIVEKESLSREQSKWTSLWDQKIPRAQESVMRSSEDKSQKHSGNMRVTKCSLQENMDQDSVIRKQMDGKKLAARNDKHLELSKGLVKRGDEGSSVTRKTELNIPVEQNLCKETNKALTDQELFQNSKERTHNKKSTSENSKKDVSPPAVPDLQKLIQKAKGARRVSEKPRCDNSNHEILHPANKNDGAYPPTDPDMKKANKARGARKFSEQPSPGNLTQVGPARPSHFDDASSHVPKLKKSQSSKLNSQKDLVAERKRQREDVNTLLSSALIPSTKPSSTRHTKKQK